MEARGSRPTHHVHESPPVMTVPLDHPGRALGGWRMGRVCPTGGCGAVPLRACSRPCSATFHTEAARGAATSAIGWVALAATFIGFALAYILYIQTPALPGRIAASASALYQVLVRKYYVDELYNAGLRALSVLGIGKRAEPRRRPLPYRRPRRRHRLRRRGWRRGHAALGDRQRPDYAFVYLLGAVGIVAYYVYLVMVR